MTPLFDPALLGLSTLSDVQTLSPVDALAGTAAADNLLILSLGSRRLVETDRSGHIFSSFDLSGVLPHNAIEGVTVDELGTIYLVAEQVQDGSNVGIDANPKSQLIVLSAPVPEPGTYAMMAAGIALVGVAARRRRRRLTA
jgi:PEP-CTERM putative exosortase interaction domain